MSIFFIVLMCSNAQFHTDLEKERHIALCQDSTMMQSIMRNDQEGVKKVKNKDIQEKVETP